MLIWANKNEINSEMVNTMSMMYGKEFEIKNFKAWELSIILRQIQRHFGERKDISILDFGAGVSPFGAYLKYFGYQSIACLDIEHGWHSEMNQQGYNDKYNTHIEYIKATIGKDSIGKYDAIFSVSVLEHIKHGRTRILKTLLESLNPNGLFIHAVDYPDGINFKELIDGCGALLSYKPEETPGCEEFKASPKYAWMNKGKSRIAFFNE